MLWFHLVNWTLGPIINTIAVSYKALGYAADPITGGWCWIYHDTTLDTKTQFIISTKEKFWITVDGKGIEIFVYTTIFVIYGLIKCRLGNEVCYSDKGYLYTGVPLHIYLRGVSF